MTFRRVEPGPSFPSLDGETLGRWRAHDTFARSVSARAGRREFVFYDGPPFPTGSPHHGTMLSSVLKDAVLRYKTMRGYHVPRVWGWDCHGLPIETQAEKNLGIREKRDIEKTVGVAAFNAECRRIVSDYNEAWKEYVERIGRWVDMETAYTTMSRPFMESVLHAFAECHRKDLVYKDHRVTPYCYRCETPLSVSDTRLDDSTRPRQDRSAVVRFVDADDPGTDYLAWTTTPWTLPSNLALGVGPGVRYAFVEHEGRTVVIAEERLPAYKAFGESPRVTRVATGSELAGRRYRPVFPYFADSGGEAFTLLAADFVTTGDGTGIVHLAPAFGEDDYWTCKKHGIRLVDPVDQRGVFDGRVPDFEGRNVHDVNSDVVRALRSRGLVFEDGTFEHNYPHCWRCRNPLIYKAVDAWYLAVEKIKDKMLAANRGVAWHPSSAGTGRFTRWLENARDWNISRNRYWATPIPVWDCDGCGAREVLGSAGEIEAKAGRSVADLHKEHLDAVVYPCGCGGSFRRTPEVLDGWFESGSMPYGQFHYPFDRAEEFRERFPADFIVEYTGQIRGWFYVMHVLSTALFGGPAFRNCMVHGTLLAADGKKISKSLKNYTDPLELIRSHGADAFRAYLLGSSSAVQSGDMSFRDDGVEDAVKSYLLPLWNALSFFTTYAEADGVGPGDIGRPLARGGETELDRYVVSELEKLTAHMTEKVDAYELHEAVRAVPEFLDTLNNWYVRRSRDRVWAAGRDAPGKLVFYDTLHHVLSRVCLLLAPFCPFVADAVWTRLGHEGSVHLADWPEADTGLIDEGLAARFGFVRSVVSAGLAVRAKERIRVRQPLPAVLIAPGVPFPLDRFEEVIREELNVKRVEIVPDPGALATRTARVDARVLGPKLGPAVQKVIRALKEGAFEVLPDGSVAAAGHVVPSGDVTIGYQGREGMSAVSVGGVVVALDLTVTPELELEGAARDLVRFVQEARKEAGLDVSDRIVLRVDGAADVLAAFGDYVKGETLAVELGADADPPSGPASGYEKRGPVGKTDVSIVIARRPGRPSLVD